MYFCCINPLVTEDYSKQKLLLVPISLIITWLYLEIDEIFLHYD